MWRIVETFLSPPVRLLDFLAAVRAAAATDLLATFIAAFSDEDREERWTAGRRFLMRYRFPPPAQFVSLDVTARDTHELGTPHLRKLPSLAHCGEGGGPTSVISIDSPALAYPATLPVLMVQPTASTPAPPSQLLHRHTAIPMADIRRLYTTVFDRLSAALSNLTMAAYPQDSDQDNAQGNSDITRNLSSRRTPSPYSPTVDDVFEVKKFISQCHPDLLPPEIVDLIMDHAEYWPSSVSAMSKPKRCVAPNNENLFVVSRQELYCLRSQESCSDLCQ